MNSALSSHFYFQHRVAFLVPHSTALLPAYNNGKPLLQPYRKCHTHMLPPSQLYALSMKSSRGPTVTTTPERKQDNLTQTTTIPNSPPLQDEKHFARIFSNLTRTNDGSLKRQPPSELACIALVAGTMIGAGVLALPTVAQESGFVPSSSVLLGIWVYMAVTGLLISEVTINTACALGRATGISMLSLSRLTLGRAGAALTAASYVFLHFAILTAYTAQGGAIIRDFATILSPQMAGALFAATIGGTMLLAPSSVVERLNNFSVAAACVAFLVVVGTAAAHADVASLFNRDNWPQVATGNFIPVAFVSCVYHNVVSSISIKLEGDRRKIRRTILLGSGIPIAMFVLYDAVMLASGGSGAASSPTGWAVDAFSVFAIATSFVGFVEGLTELCADVRETANIPSESRWPNFVATLFPPIMLAAASPDIFFKALDVAGTYGIAVLFGIIPAAMAWQNRRKPDTKDFSPMIGGGNTLLTAIVALPLALIGSKLWALLTTSFPLSL